MKFKKAFLALTVSAFIMSGCSSDSEKDSALDANGTDASTSALNDGSLNGSQFGGNAGGLGGSGSGFGSNSRLGPEFSDPSNPLSKQIIYFELDSSQVKQQFLPVITAHAQYLASHPNQHIILGGHTDERGSSEYNISLGEQRGKAVERLLRAQGASASQLEVVSYGEEKPAAVGHNESAWSQNRRVEVGYQ